MRKSLLFFCPLFFGSIILFVDKKNDEIAIANSYEQQRASNAIGCAPAVDEFNMNATGKFIPVMPGWGNYSYTITTNNDSAQLYFNQGLTMYYSYHSREAIASFKEAAKFDSLNAMVYWGQALAMGPSYNFGYIYFCH